MTETLATNGYGLEICHALLDLLITNSGTIQPNTSPTTPSSPSPHPSPSQRASLPTPPSNYSSAYLTRLKISLREKGNVPRPRVPLAKADPSAEYGVGGSMAGFEAEGLGKNEGTVRFLFGMDG